MPAGFDATMGGEATPLLLCERSQLSAEADLL